MRRRCEFSRRPRAGAGATPRRPAAGSKTTQILTMRTRLAQLPVALLFGLASQAPADWPLFRGNAQQTGVAPAPLPAMLEVLWKFQAKDAIEGTPAVAGGIVYVGAMDEFLYALDLADGKEKWRYKA